MGHETDQKTADHRKATASSISAALFEFISKIVIERTFFQSSTLSPTLLIYLVNDVIQSFHQKIQHPEKFSFYKESSILYKQLRGKTLTDDEKRYDQEIHELDVIGEVVNGLRYAVGFSVFKGMFNSISSAITQKLTEHVPYIAGYTTASYLGPLFFPKLVDLTLSKTKLTDHQKNILRPWLNSLGRLVMAFTPKVEANQAGVTYQYPSPSGHYKWYRNISLAVLPKNALPDQENLTEFKGDEILSFKISGLKSIHENKVEINVTNPKNEAHTIKFSFTERSNERELKIECSDQAIGEECYSHLSKMFPVPTIQQQDLQTPQETETPALQLPSFNSFINTARNFASSMVIPSLILASTRAALSKNHEMSSRTQNVLLRLLAQTALTAAINPLQGREDPSYSLIADGLASANQDTNFYQTSADMPISETTPPVKITYRKPRPKLKNSDVNPMSTEYQVNTIVDANQQNSAVAIIRGNSKLAGNLLYIYETYTYFDTGNKLLLKVLTPYGEEIIPESTNIPHPNTFDELYPNLVALPDGNVFAVSSYSSTSGNSWEIVGHYYSFNSTSVFLEKMVLSPGSRASIALINNSDILSAWLSNMYQVNSYQGTVNYQAYSLNGTISIPKNGITFGSSYCTGLSLSANPAGGYAIAVAINPSSFIISEQSQEIWILPFNNQGMQLPRLMIARYNNNFTINYNAVIRSFPNSNWIVVYNSYNTPATGPTPQVTNFEIYNYTLQPLSPLVTLDYPISKPFVATSTNNNFLIIGQMYNNLTVFYDVVGQFFSGIGKNIGNLFVAHYDVHDVQVNYMINPYLDNYSPSDVLVNLEGDDFSMTYTSVSQDGSMNGVFARYFDSSFGVYTANWTVTFPEGSVLNGLNDFSNPAFYNPDVIYYLTLSNPALGNLTVTTPPISCQVSYDSSVGEMIIAGQSYAVNKEVFPNLQLISVPSVYGVFSLNVTAVDLSNFNPTFYRLMTLNVTERNYPPIAPQIPSQVVLVGSNYNFTFPPFDDNSAVSYTAALTNGSQLPRWLGLNKDARQFYSVSPPTQQDVTLDTMAINVMGCDDYGGTANATFFMSVIPSLSVNNLNPTSAYNESAATDNCPINFTLPLNIQSPRETAMVSLRLFDCGAGNITTSTFRNTSSFFNVSNCEWIAEGPITDVETLYLLAQYQRQPYYYLNFPILQLIRDYYNNDLTGMISMRGTRVNYPPQVSQALLNVTEVVGVDFVIPVANTFTSPNNDHLTYIAYAINQTMPTWIRFDNYTFFGNAPNVGVFGFGVAAVDPYNNSASSNFSLTVINPRSGGGLRSWQIGLIVVGNVAIVTAVLGGIIYCCVKGKQDPFTVGLFEGGERDRITVTQESVKAKIKEIKKYIRDYLLRSRDLSLGTDEEWKNMGRCFRDALMSPGLSKDYKGNDDDFKYLFRTDNQRDTNLIMDLAAEHYFNKQPAHIQQGERSVNPDKESVKALIERSSYSYSKIPEGDIELREISHEEDDRLPETLPVYTSTPQRRCTLF